MILRDVLEFHAFCLARTGTRLDQYARALDAVLRPGDVVLDLGAGLGVLAAMACRRGAARVYAVEGTPAAVEFGRQLVDAAGLGGRITFLAQSSFEVVLPEPVDVIVSDVHGPFGLQDHGASAIHDARDRWLKPSGLVIPSQVELLVGPVEAPDTYAHHVGVWMRTVHGFDVSRVREWAVNLPYPARLEAAALLAPLATLGVVDLEAGRTPAVSGRRRFTVARAGTLHGVCGATKSTLSPGVTISNVPGAAETTNYACLFLPLAEPTALEAGDIVEVDVAVFDSSELRWRVVVTRPSVGALARFEHATLHALPALPAHARKLGHDYRPLRTEEGSIEMELLAQFDGTRTVADLRAWLEARAPGPDIASRRARLLRATIERAG
jgi:protein arginine N-methyltransferase 1